MVTTLINKKDTINHNVVIVTLLSHSRRRQSIDERNKGECLYVNEGQDFGRKKKVKTSSRKKRSKSKNTKTKECSGCKQIEYWMRDYLQKSRTHQVLRTWSKLMIFVVKEIYFVFHLKSSQKCGFFTLDAITTWHRTERV